MTLIERLGFSGRFKDLSAENQKTYMRAYRAENPDRVKSWNANSRKKHDPIKAAERWKQWHRKNREAHNKRQRERRHNDPLHLEKQRADYRKNAAKRIANTTIWRKNNPDKHRLTAASHREKNRHKLRTWRNKRHTERYYSDPQYRIAHRLRCRLYELLRKANHTESVTLKMDKASVVSHMEKRFLPGMSWENHGKAWHIDHIIPCSAFDLTVPEQREYCFSLTNLQPLWAQENRAKSDTIPADAVVPFPLKKIA